MLTFLLQNAATIVISLLLAAAVTLIILGITKKKRRGQCASCDGCDKATGCPHHDLPQGKK